MVKQGVLLTKVRGKYCLLSRPEMQIITPRNNLTLLAIGFILASACHVGCFHDDAVFVMATSRLLARHAQ